MVPCIIRCYLQMPYIFLHVLSLGFSLLYSLTSFLSVHLCFKAIQLSFGYFLEVRPSFLLYIFHTWIIVYISTKRKTIGCTQQKRETIPICAQSHTATSDSTRTTKCQPTNGKNGMCHNTERVSSIHYLKTSLLCFL